MPYALLILGIVFTVSGVQGTQGKLFDLVRGDFSGQNSFIFWAASIIGIGAVGYVPDLRKLANSFLVLILVVLILKNGGVFSKFSDALKTSATPSGNAATPANSNDGGLGAAEQALSGGIASLQSR